METLSRHVTVKTMLTATPSTSKHLMDSQLQILTRLEVGDCIMNCCSVLISITYDSQLLPCRHPTIINILCYYGQSRHPYQNYKKCMKTTPINLDSVNTQCDTKLRFLLFLSCYNGKVGHNGNWRTLEYSAVLECLLVLYTILTYIMWLCVKNGSRKVKETENLDRV